MAITITPDDLSIALRLATTTAEATALPEGQRAIVGRLFATASALVERYAPLAPDAIQNEAAIRCGSYLYDSDPADARTVRSPLQLSGASALLASYRTHRLVAHPALRVGS